MLVGLVNFFKLGQGRTKREIARKLRELPQLRQLRRIIRSCFCLDRGFSKGVSRGDNGCRQAPWTVDGFIPTSVKLLSFLVLGGGVQTYYHDRCANYVSYASYTSSATYANYARFTTYASYTSYASYPSYASYATYATYATYSSHTRIILYLPTPAIHASYIWDSLATKCYDKPLTVDINNNTHVR